MSAPRSPLAPARFPDLPVIAGLRLASAAANIRYVGRDDVMLALLDPGTTLAGTFTKSSTRSASVLDCQAKITQTDSTEGAAILVNAGNANAFTGRHGQASVDAICAAVSKATGVPAARVFTSSTGVIGEPLPHDQITAKLDALASAVSPEGLKPAAHAIMTTDTYAKGSSQQVKIGDRSVAIAGIAKGSGMIAPDMATMLVYIFTDAQIAQDKLQNMVGRATDATFNCITVDSDTSTSDTVLVAATGASGVDVTDSEDFADALQAVMQDLALQVVRDGEGATKLVEVVVTGAQTAGDARTHALSIANSPLVKTAIAGEDPNWGRVVMAIGKSGAPADRDRLQIWFGDILVATEGWVAPTYQEAEAARYMKRSELCLRVDLGLGDGQARVWTCDLTHQYIDINADYRS